jgi:5-methyltetrahydropteroyltriglutamate--homocysteine methyltransferase
LREAIAEHEETGRALDSGQVRDAVDEIVRSQRDAGVDVVNDGEAGKVGYSTYVKERLTGFEGEDVALSIHDLEDYPQGHKVWEFRALSRSSWGVLIARSRSAG